MCEDLKKFRKDMEHIMLAEIQHAARRISVWDDDRGSREYTDAVFQLYGWRMFYHFLDIAGEAGQNPGNNFYLAVEKAAFCLAEKEKE